jgi:hypothetical protein
VFKKCEKEERKREDSGEKWRTKERTDTN